MQHLTTGLFTQRGEAVHVLRREVFVGKGGFIQRVVVVAARYPVQAQRLAPFAAEDIQKQVGPALAAADDGDALAREIRRAQHHLAGVEAGIVLRGDAVRQVDLLANPHADVARQETVALGHHLKQAAFLIKAHLLYLLAEGEIGEVFRRPAQVVRKLFAGDGALLGGQEAIELFALHQVVQEAVAVGWLHGADQILQEAGLHVAVRHHHSRVPGEVRFTLKEQRAKAVQPFGQSGDAEVKRANTNADEIIGFHCADSREARKRGLSRSVT